MPNTEKHIYHVTEKVRWAEALTKGQYLSRHFDNEGFIHLCTKKQLKKTADKIYSGQPDLVVLKIDVNKLKAPVKFENLTKGDELFPHLYGPLNIDAVVEFIFLGLTHEGDLLWPDKLF